MIDINEALTDRTRQISLALSPPDLPSHIERAIEAIILAAKNRNTIIAFGNGGNASNAEQLITELIARYCYDRGPLPAIALTAAGPFSAICNDYGYNTGFARQIEALARAGDVVVGYSSSGRSPNVIEAVRQAQQNGATTVGFSGETGSLKTEVDIPLAVASTFTPTCEEAHLIITHLICDRVEIALFSESGNRIRTPEYLTEGGDA